MKQLFFILLLFGFFGCSEETKRIFDVGNPSMVISKGTFVVKKVISGDFDGDGNEEKLKEMIVSAKTGDTMDVFPDVIYDSLVDWVNEMGVKVSLTSDNIAISELVPSNSPALGFMWVSNVGDLNADGSDEVAIVSDHADWSSVNRCIVYSFKNGKWSEFIRFEIREWQIYESPNFDGFIKTNEEGNTSVLTLDSNMMEVWKPLDEVLIQSLNF